MNRCSADVVIGVEQRLGQQRANVPAAEAIHDPLAVTLPFDEPGEAEFGQVLAGHGWPAARDRSEAGDVELRTTQRPQHLHPRGIRQECKRRDGSADLLGRQLVRV